MKLEIYDDEYVGSAEWRAPGSVLLDVRDEARRGWFERFFQAEDSFMNGSLGFEEMAMERRDSSAEAFSRAAFTLAAYSYRVRLAEDIRSAAEGEGSG